MQALPLSGAADDRLGGSGIIGNNIPSTRAGKPAAADMLMQEKSPVNVPFTRLSVKCG